MYEYGNIFWSPTIHVDGNEVIITLSKSRDRRERLSSSKYFVRELRSINLTLQRPNKYQYLI